MKEIRHRETAQYYDALLGRAVERQRQLAICNDTADLSNLSSKRLAIGYAHRASRPAHGGDGFLAIEDAHREGEPEELKDIQHDVEEMRAHVDANKSHLWGPFRFTYVERLIKSGPRAGSMLTQWQCTCKYHKNTGDGATQCTKTESFAGDLERDLVAHKLRAWCIAGRDAAIQNSKKQHGSGAGHQDCGFAKFVKMSDSQLNDLLAQGLAADDWIRVSKEGDPDVSSSSSSGD